jgi:hypothetical protein
MDQPPSATGTLRTFVTDDPQRFAVLASRFLEMEIDPPTLVNLSDVPEFPQHVSLRAAG